MLDSVVGAEFRRTTMGLSAEFSAPQNSRMILDPGWMEIDRTPLAAALQNISALILPPALGILR
jgi:hypothetical protein